MTNRYVKRHSSFINRETKKIRTILRCHCIPGRMVIIKMTSNKCCPGRGEKEAQYTVSGNVNSYSHYENLKN